MGRGDGVKITGKMQVDIFHRNHLGMAAASRPALHAKTGAERGLAQANQRLLTDPVQPVTQPDRCGRLTLTGRGRVDRGDQNQLCILLVRLCA